MSSQEEPEAKQKMLKQILRQLAKSLNTISSNSKRDYYQSKNAIK